ncbi:MAG: DUF3570 domain-containing protein [Flavobacterium sp.]
MKKICLSVAGIFLALFSSFAQTSPKEDTAYKSRKLKLEEVNIVSSYYHQDGNHAAVTGGIGSQQLTDLSNSIDLKLSKYDKQNRKHSFTAELGIDHYTSASSDKIDPKTISSASHADTRIYPSFGWTMENEKKGTTIGAGIYASSEFDYKSSGGNISFAKKTRDRTGEFSIKLQAYLDNLKLIYPVELRTNGEHYATAGRNTYSATLGWSQVVNKNLQVMIEGELVYQEGYLGLPFNRVYFTDNSVHAEKLPSTRLKIPIGIRANYFLGDAVILRAWYRYYKDDWNISSNVAQLETTFKLNPFLSLTPFYRYYQQTAADYFAPYQVHSPSDAFYTSNYDLSKFTSSFYGIGFRMAPPKGVFNIQHVNSMEIRYGHYQKNIDMNSNIISLHLKFK